jgi:asparagine synthase (glutamine-hydrolysing)
MLLEYDQSGKLDKSKNNFWFSNHLKIKLIDGIPCNIRYYEKQNYVIFIVGHPILNNKIDDENLIISLLDKKFTNLNKIDGSFLIILFNKDDYSLRIINDRFAAFPIYYVKRKKFYASTSLYHLHHFISNDVYNSFDEKAVLSFLWFRKVLGNKTFNKNIKFLDYASTLLVYRGSNISIIKYWRIKYNDKVLKGKELVDTISNSLKKSVISHMSDEKNFGLFLSGGIDSRAIIAASEKYIECYTSGVKKNNEYRVASKIASVKNYNHNFIQRDLSFYNDKYIRAIKLAPMQIFTESQFLDHEKYIGNNCNVMMTGLGLDILLSGLYLNKKNSFFLGRKMLHYKLANIRGNIVDYYINNVKYKLKSTSLISLFNSKFKKNFREILFNQVEEIVKIGKNAGAKDHSLWEFMHIYNMSRHYSFPMMESIRTFAECRSPGISNDILDISLSMDIKEKVNGQAYHEAIRSLSKEIMNIKNANTNLSASYSLPMQSLIKSINRISSLIGLENKITSPDWSERSWPKPYLQFKSSFSLIKEINNLPHCRYLQEMGIFDMNRIKKLVNESKYVDHTIMLYLLLNLSIFFKKEKNSF